METAGRNPVYLTLVLTAIWSTATAYNCIRLRHAPGSCYIFKTSPASWREALHDCATRHSGHLVTMETEREFDAVHAHLKAHHDGQAYFVGALTIDGHLTWFWTLNGALLQLPDSKWESGQPDNSAGSDENCAAMDFRAGRQGRLADIGCREQSPYICEVPTPDYMDYYGGGFRLEERSSDWPWG